MLNYSKKISGHHSKVIESTYVFSTCKDSEQDGIHSMIHYCFFQSSLDMPSVSIELTLHYGKYFSLLWRYNNVLLFNAYSSIFCKTLYWWAHIFVSGLHTVFKYYWRSKTLVISPGVHRMFRGATSESAVNQTHVLQ